MDGGRKARPHSHLPAASRRWQAHGLRGPPQLFADSGIENINCAVDDTLFSACLERVLAQVDIGYSNSMIL